MHVIAYFGVWKCYVCSHLCNCMLNLVMQCCLFKYICWCSVDRVNHIAHGLNNGTRRWWFHQSLTIVYRQSFAHNTHGLLTGIVCVVICPPTHFWLQTCLPRITHILLSWTVFVPLAQRKQFIWVNYMPYIAHTFIWLPVSFVPPHRKQLIELNHMPCIAHATKIWTVFDASSIANVLHLFWWFFTPPFAIMASHTVSSKGLWS